MKYASLLPLAFIAMVVTTSPAVRAAGLAAACAGTAHRGMDYAIGTWVARDAKRKVLGKGEWAKTLDGCAIHFTWEGRTYRGNANNAYDGTRNRWQKAFYSNTGDVELSEGHVVAGTMVYIGVDYDKGKAVQMHREKLLRLHDGRLNFHYELSEDHGKTWKLAGNAFSTRVDRRTFEALAIGSAARDPRPGAAAGFHGGLAYVPITVHGTTVSALLDTGGYDYVEPAAVVRLRLPTVPIRVGGRPRRAVVASSGDGLLVARSGAFEATFLERPEATVSLSYLRGRIVTIDFGSGRTSRSVPAGPAAFVKLLLRAGPPPSPRLPPQAFAALEATVAGERALWLLDTGAEARFLGEAGTTQVSAVDARVAERWHKAHPEWPYRVDAALYADQDGAARVDAIRVPLAVGTLPARSTWCVVRHEARSFDSLSRAFGRTVIGDAGSTAFGPRRVTLDLSRERLEIR